MIPGRRVPSTGDVALQLLDLGGLLLDHSLDQIADRQDTEHPAGLHHRKMPEAALGHDLHAVPHAVGEGHGDRRSRHDLAHRRVLGGAVLQDHLAGVIALRNDADEGYGGRFGAGSGRHHEERAHMVGGHELDGLAYRVGGRDPEELVAFLTQQMTDGLHGNPQPTGPRRSPTRGKSGPSRMTILRPLARTRDYYQP